MYLYWSAFPLFQPLDLVLNITDSNEVSSVQNKRLPFKCVLNLSDKDAGILSTD